MTGNTHRTEFCIDKMYAPEGGTGRRGLVEFRAFRDAAARADVGRADAADARRGRRVLAAPYERRLVRWGTRLHDEFMLPHYCEQDFAGCAARICALWVSLRAGLVRAASGIPLSADRRGRAARDRRSSCAMRWSRGTCWARNRRPAARRAMSTARRSGCRRGVAAGSDERYRAGLQRRAPCR